MHFISYGKVKFPRMFTSDRDKAQEWAAYYMNLGYKHVNLRTCNNPDTIRDIANRWVAMWGRSDIADIRAQREAEAEKLRAAARTLEPGSLTASQALQSPCFAGASSHDVYVNSGKMF